MSAAGTHYTREEFGDDVYRYEDVDFETLRRISYRFACKLRVPPFDAEDIAGGVMETLLSRLDPDNKYCLPTRCRNGAPFHLSLWVINVTRARVSHHRRRWRDSPERLSPDGDPYLLATSYAPRPDELLELSRAATLLRKQRRPLALVRKDEHSRTRRT